MKKVLNVLIILVVTLMTMSFSCKKDDPVTPDNPTDPIKPPVYDSLIGTWEFQYVGKDGGQFHCDDLITIYHAYRIPWDMVFTKNNGKYYVNIKNHCDDTTIYCNDYQIPNLTSTGFSLNDIKNWYDNGDPVTSTNITYVFDNDTKLLTLDILKYTSFRIVLKKQ